MTLKPDSALDKDRRTAQHTGAFKAFQHRHYAAIASIVAAMWDTAERDSLAVQFANAFAVNPHFDRKRFLAACKTEDVA